jgi:hypothetical protein
MVKRAVVVRSHCLKGIIAAAFPLFAHFVKKRLLEASRGQAVWRIFANRLHHESRATCLLAERRLLGGRNHPAEFAQLCTDLRGVSCLFFEELAKLYRLRRPPDFRRSDFPQIQGGLPVVIRNETLLAIKNLLASLNLLEITSWFRADASAHQNKS